MVRGRRVTTPSAQNDSEKENSMPRSSANTNPGRASTSVKVKEEGGRAEDASQSANGYADDANGTQEQGSDLGDEGDSDDGSPKARKRARVSEGGEAAETDNGLGHDLPRRVTLPRREDGYLPGSIVRVQLKNFVTYDYVEFRPGPYLNMILGPNGTGKSSIACALCLGLNFPPSVLGRATEISAFVKNTADKGHIEIELRGPPNERNLVIRRELTNKNKSSTFTLNGKQSTGKEVSSRIAELNIQVGNLCSFLPQDKVSEFARMSPQQLLRETQRAAGDSNLTAWHNTLIEAGKDLLKITEELRTEENELQALAQRNQRLEAEVERLNRRKEIEHAIEFLELLLPFVEYLEVRRRYSAAKSEQRTLHERVTALTEKNAPAHELKKELETQLDRANKDREKKKSSATSKFKQAQKKMSENDSLENEAEAVQRDIDNIKKVEKARQDTIAKLEKQLEKLQSIIDNPPAVESLDPLNQDMRSIQAELNKIKQRLEDLRPRQEDNAQQTGTYKAEIDDALRQLQQLDNKSHVKLQALERWNRDAADAIKWLRQNQDKFRFPVVEPAFMTVTVQDKRYTDAVEACFNATNFVTFVCQCQEDLDSLNRYINDTGEALGRRARISTWYRAVDERALPQPPMSRDELHKLGFDAYAMDLIQFPEPMRAYLMSEMRLHCDPIALNDRSVNHQVAMEAVAPSGQGDYVAGRTHYHVTRSRYGKKAVTSATRDIKGARNLVDAIADQNLKQGIEIRLREARLALAAAEQEAEALIEEDRKIRAEGKTHNDNLRDVKARREAVLDAIKEVQKSKAQRDRMQKQLRDELDKPSANERRPELNKRLLRISRKRLALVEQLPELMRAANDDLREASRLALHYLQISANRSALEKYINDKDQDLARTQAAYEKANKHFQKVKAESKEKLEISKTKLNQAPQQLVEEFEAVEEEARDKEPEEIRQELGHQRAALELFHNANSGVIEEFENRKRQIEDLEKKILGHKKRSEKIKGNIDIARRNWQPALEKLVASIGKKFSTAFDRIGCAGEIKISENEDYDKWAIDILVKFRDNEKLQLLTAHRQSGGERSLTTIMYLLSLTEEARAPFSLVDEINQGMDQRNEEAVHDQMVQVTCQPDSAQYFLITPKLLPGLRYHELMKVLCVNNGEWIPEAKERAGNMMNLIDNFVKRRAGSRSTA